MNRDQGSLKPVTVELKATVAPNRKISFAENINRLLTAIGGEEERPFRLHKTTFDDSSKFLNLSQHKVRTDLSQQAEGDAHLA